MSASPDKSTVVTEVTLRYSDMDPMGHLNNAVYATFFEAGRVAYVDEVLTSVTPEGAGYVIVKLTVEFRSEVKYPGVVQVLTRMSRVGGSSMTYAQEMHVNDKLVATAESVCALFDMTRRKALRCPEDMRALLKSRGAEG
jgi:acyl-CoA thioester hydrolase